MKTVIIIIDGLGDEPLLALNGRTPLDSAFIPHMQYISCKGQTGSLKTVFPRLPVESSICIMGLLGYDPYIYYPGGRASFEAIAKGISTGKDDLLLRCNLITIDRNKQIITDFTGGMITDTEAENIISNIKLPFNNWELYHGQRYRNILVIREANIRLDKIKFFEPHMNLGTDIKDIMPQSYDLDCNDLIEEINEFLLNTQKQIEEINLPGKSANMLWLWSPSASPCWPSFQEKTGLKAVIVCGADFLHGIATAGNIHFDIIPGATAYIDTDYEAKGIYTLKYLKDFDFILTHINAPDEAAHQKDYRGKREAIEMVDKLIVAPVLHELEKKYGNDFRIIVCGDHNTRCSDGKHTDSPVPFAMYGKGILPCKEEKFSEEICLKKRPVNSIEFFNYLTK